MNHNKHVAVIISVLMLFTMLYVPSYSIVVADDPPFNSTDNLGYELLDNGSVFHMWNRFNHYYFNVSNGVQFTNHYNEYWSHNVMMIGYLTGENITDPDDWNLIYRTDKLSGFNRRIGTDNQTYINVTLWKDLSYGNYDFRLAIQYHLGVDDMDLSVTPYVKNLGIPIPFVTAFGWEVKDIKIGGIEYNSSIYINQTGYMLNQTPLDERYTNLTRVVMLWNETSQQNENVTIPNTIYTLYGGTHQHQELYLKWNGTQLKNKYLIWVKNRTGHYNAPVTLFIKIGTLGAGQEKYTTMHWLDSPDSVNLLPDSEGNVQQWTPRPSEFPTPIHWNKVDDPIGTPDEDATYVYTAVSDKIEDFNHVTSDLLTGATISNVRLTARMRYVASGLFPAALANLGLVIGMQRYSSGMSAIITGSYVNYYYDWNVNPADSGAWEKSDIDGLQSSLLSVGLVQAALRCTQVYLTVTYTPPDTTPPAITIKFAGNLSDSGGPYWQPPGESTPLAGAYSDGYYANDSRQNEDWMYIRAEVTDTDGVGVDNVKLCWYNQSSDSWDNTTAFTPTMFVNLWEVNTSRNIIVSAGYNYSFNIWANDTSNNINITWWNKTGLGGGLTRRWVQLDCNQVNTSYSPYYFVTTTPFTGTYGAGDANKEDRLHHDQGAEGILTDTGYINATEPTDTVSLRSCSSFLGYWFEDSTCIEPFTIDNIYYHFWWATDTDEMTCVGYNYSREDLSYPKAGEYYSTSSANNRSSIYYDNNLPSYSNNYYLEADLFTVSGPSFTDNNIYELAMSFLETPEDPSVISNRSFTSFVLFNVPDNATLNASYADSDSDSLSDWTELYKTYTNPFLADTDNDGVSDYDENMSGSDPNDYTDTIPYNNAPTQSGEVPVNTSTGISTTPTLNVTVDDADDDILTAYWYSNSSGAANENWWDSDWDYYRTITLDSSKIDNDLVNFPMLVNSTNASLIAKCQANGEDVRFLSLDNTTEFAYEIEGWNAGGFSIWVNISETLTSGSDYEFLMYYGNSEAPDNQNPNGVWDSNFKAVYHMNDKTTSTIDDSTSNSKDGTKLDDNDPIETSSGKVGNAQHFDGTEDRIACGTVYPVGASEGLTLSAWVKFDTLATHQQIASTNDGTTGYYNINYNANDDKFVYVVYDGADYIPTAGTTTPVIDTWYYVTMVVNRDDDLTHTYLNGTEETTGDISAVGAIPCNIFTMGAHVDEGTPNYWLDGIIDEMRVSSISLNASWINASFHSQNQTTGFLTFGSEENLVTGGWALFATNSSIYTSGGAVNIIQTNSNFSEYSTTYYWSINLTDGTDWTNETYHFATEDVLWIDVTNATWALGLVVMGTSIWTNETGKTFICDMDNTTVNTDLSLQITIDGATWHDGAIPAGDVYRLNASIDTWGNEFLITEASDQTISVDITAGQNETFDSRFDAPTITTTGVQQTITITATIVKH